MTRPFPDARKKNMLPLRAMHGATGGRARTFRWARGAEPCCAAHEKVSRQPFHLQRVGRCKASLTADVASQHSRAVGARKYAPWWPAFTAPDASNVCPRVRHGTVVYNRGVKWGPTDPACLPSLVAQSKARQCEVQCRCEYMDDATPCSERIAMRADA